jgi:CubicO group peptidase (beta-lactamase class C family)
VHLPFAVLLVFAAIAPGTAARIDATVRQTMARMHVAGLALAVAGRGAAIYAKGYGASDLARRTPVTPATRFPIGSISKQFTVAAVLQAASAGALSLDDPLTKFFPQYRQGASITLEMLLSQTSGIPSSAGPATIFRDGPHFSPGTQWEYSNANYLLLGMVLEKAERAPYRALVARICDRAKLPATGVFASYAGFATGYRFDGMRNVRAKRDRPADLFGFAGIASNAIDVLHWESALYDGRIVGPALARRMFEATLLPGGASTGYGYAVFVRRSNGRVVYFHPGNIDGYSSVVMTDPLASVQIVILTNEDSVDLLPLARSVDDLLDTSPQ